MADTLCVVTFAILELIAMPIVVLWACSKLN